MYHTIYRYVFYKHQRLILKQLCGRREIVKIFCQHFLKNSWGSIILSFYRLEIPEFWSTKCQGLEDTCISKGYHFEILVCSLSIWVFSPYSILIHSAVYHSYMSNLCWPLNQFCLSSVSLLISICSTLYIKSTLFFLFQLLHQQSKSCLIQYLWNLHPTLISFPLDHFPWCFFCFFVFFFGGGGCMSK